MFFVISMILLNVFSGDQLGPVQAIVLTMLSPFLERCLSMNIFVIIKQTSLRLQNGPNPR